MMRGSTFTLRLSRFARRNARKNLPFCFSLPFLSLYPILLSLPCLLSLLFFLFFSFLSFLIHPHFLLLFVPSSSLFISFHLLFSHCSSFSHSSFSFSFFFILSFGLPSPVWIKWGKLPPTFLLGHLSLPCFSSLFSLFSFSLLLHHVTHGSM